jgi:hypothetical protein
MRRKPLGPSRLPTSPRLLPKKKANREWLALGEWWRGRESNLRPQLEQPIFHLALLCESWGANSHNELRRLSGLLAFGVAVPGEPLV